MEELLALSKSADGRQQLLDSGRLQASAAQAAQLLPQWTPQHPDGDLHQLLTLLRLLRNSCAAGAAAAAVLLQHSLALQAAQFAAAAAAAAAAARPAGGEATASQQLLLAAVQLLANLSAAAPDAAAAVWAALFPFCLQHILAAQQGPVHEAAALAALSCIRHSSSIALSDITSAAASQVWQRLLASMVLPQEEHRGATGGSNGTAAAPGAAASHTSTHMPAPAPSAQAEAVGHDNVCLLVKCVALQHGRLQQVMQCLSPQPIDGKAAAAPEGSGGSSSSGGGSGHGRGPCCMLSGFVATPLHAVLLHVVAVELAAIPAASPLPGLQPTGDHPQGQQACGWLQYVVALLRVVWQQVVTAVPSGPGVCSQPTAAAHVLEALLQVLKAVLAREEEVEGRKGASNQAVKAAAAAGIAAAAQQLDGLGLVPLLLDMLRALGPPPKTKQEQQRQLEQAQAQAQAGTQAEAPPPPPQHYQPYVGYRGDVIAVLGNLLFGQRGVQDDVLARGGVELLLASTNLDEGAPLAREWALWAIRNMCEGNADVQAHVSQYRAVGAVQSTELDRMGMQLQLDNMTHTLKLIKKPGQEPVLVEQQE